MESRCRYTRINGARCAMPALNGHDLCFQHQQRKRQAQRKPAPSDPKAPGPLVDLVYMDDHTSVLANLNAIAEAFAYGLIDHHQASVLTRLVQLCLKTLRQKQELEPYEEDPDELVREVAYDDDGFALAVDPARQAKTISKISSSAPDPTPPAPEPIPVNASEMRVDAKPATTASAAPPNQQHTSFQTLTSKPSDKSHVFKHLPKLYKTSPLFSNTCASLDEKDPLQLAIDGPPAWSAGLTRSILNALKEME